jgi:hypothetical protein
MISSHRAVFYALLDKLFKLCQFSLSSQLVLLISDLLLRFMMNGNGHDNVSFVGDSIYTIPSESRRSITQFYPGKHFPPISPPPAQFQVQVEKQKKEAESGKSSAQERDSWGKGIEFLLSCIAMSVGKASWRFCLVSIFLTVQTFSGLGNIWRFPFIARKFSS